MFQFSFSVELFDALQNQFDELLALNHLHM